MAEIDCYSIRDGETLLRLESGLVIIRRKKHEWQPKLAKLSAIKLAKRTDKEWGSKFLSDWTLPVLVAWITTVVSEEGWTPQTGRRFDAIRVLGKDVEKMWAWLVGTKRVQ